MSDNSTPSVRFDGFTNDWEQRQASHNVPAVRFKADDGSDFPAWEDRQFLELIDRIIDYRGKTPKKIGLEWTPEPTKYLALSALNVKQGYIDFAVDPHYGDKALYDKWMTGNELYPGEVVITTEAPMGNVVQIPDSKPYILSQRVIAFIPQGDLVSDDYLACLLRSPQVQNQLRNLATGGTAQGISQRSLTRVKVTIPSLPEQKKIAACLSSADETIALCQRKLDLLTQAKKALMQQIFSQKLRFKADDGSDFPEWEEKKLGDIADVFGGGTPSTENPEYWDGDVQWFTPTEVGHSKYVSKSVRSISHLGLEKSSAKLLPKGALLLTSRATVGDISIAVNECCTNQGFQSLVVKDGIDNEFIYYAQPLIKRYCLQHAAGSTFIEISGKNLAKMPISIPSLPEQKKIAACLSSADAFIDQARVELEQWQKVKKSLLQQLFV